MRERPILLNAEMVRAVLDGRKTQTRRMLTPRHLKMIDAAASIGECYPLESGHKHENSQSYYRECCPFGAVGDRLWVRETWQGPLVGYDDAYSMFKDPTPFQKVENCVYRADGGPCPEFTDADDELKQGWRPSIHMPRWASRITLEITGVRVERLNNISEADAIDEGLAEISKDGRIYKYGVPDREGYPGTDDYGWPWHEWERYPISAYCKLWKSIYGEESWQANPWVWVSEFKRVEGEA